MKIKLGELTKITTGKLDANASSADGAYPFFTCSKDTLKIATYSYDCECILVAGNGDLNVKYYKGKFDAYQRTYIIEDNGNGKLYIPYLYFFMESYVEELRKMSIGGVIKYIKLGNLTDAVIELPDISIQKEIVFLIDKVKEIIDIRKQQLKMMDTLIKARFVEMFGDPILNSLSLPLVTLAELGEWSSGGTPARNNPSYFTGDIDWYSAGELNSLYLEGSTEKITHEALENSAAKLFGEGSMLVGMYDTAALKLGILRKPSASNQACACITPNKKVSIVWLYHMLMIMRPRFLEQRRGIRQKNLNLGMIKGFQIPYPSIIDQEQFSSFVSQIYKSKVGELFKKINNKNLFDMKGKRRVYKCRSLN